MSTLFRRYEFLLPLKFNDGTPVPESLFVDTLLEIEMASARYPRTPCRLAVNGGTKASRTTMI
jgi:hypothetical protein